MKKEVPDPSSFDRGFAGQLVLICVGTLFFCWIIVHFFFSSTSESIPTMPKHDSALWQVPDTATLGHSPADEQIRYGRALIVNTAYYLGPQGTIAHISNGMNCQNCHLDAGTKAYGNNYCMVASTYPKYRERSGSVESIYKRINDCMQRSLNGKALDTTQAEIRAMRAYISWLGKDVIKEHKPKGTGITELTYMDRAADPLRGRTIYEKQCQSCHQTNGSGIKTKDSVSYQYPPLWGEHSYNVGAGLYRLSRLAGYVRSNMPLGTSYDQPALTEEEAWDVAAYINSQPRPGYDLSHDWPRIAAKPVDHPFGPYADTFSTQRHKYGPYAAMVKRSKEKK